MFPFEPAEAIMVKVFCMNVAVMFLSPLIVTDIGLLDPLASPLQLIRLYPVDGIAVSCTVVALSYKARSGEFETEPLPTVCSVRLNCVGGKGKRAKMY